MANKTKLGLKILGATLCGGLGLIASTANHVNKITKVVKYFKNNSNQYKQEAADAIRDYEINLKACRDKSIDVAVISGATFIYAKSLAEISPDVLKAYEMAYPDIAAQKCFLEQVETLHSPEAILGFTNGIKGKLFEIQYADYLNNGHLPDGFHASLAEAANQPGHDLIISGPNGEVSQFLQLKATESASYIQEALHRYPDIPVVATDEVFLSVAGKELLEGGNVMPSGISDHAIETLAQSNIDHAQDAWFKTPGSIPTLSILIILFHEGLKQDKTLYQKSFSVGDRSASAIIHSTIATSVATVAGGLVGVAALFGYIYITNKAQADLLLSKQYQKMTQLYQEKSKNLAELLIEKPSFFSKLKRIFSLSW